MNTVTNIKPINTLWVVTISKKITIILICLWMSAVLYSQEEHKSKVTFNGSASFTDNFYSANGIVPRQPGNMLTGIIRANLTLFDQVELPFELYMSTQQTRFQQPFNQFGINPKISDWLTLHAGYFSTQFSDLSYGDLRMFGGGFELTPGKFRLKAIYGRTRKASESDKALFLPGVYRQTAYAFSVGYGDESKSFLNLNVFHAMDDSASIKRDTFGTMPNENIVTSLSFGFKMGEKVFFTGETGMSAFTSNTSSEKSNEGSLPSFLITTRTSTKKDGAVKLNIHIVPSGYWSLMLSTQWIGPGFTSLGYALLPSDLFEYGIAPTLKLFKNKFNLRAKTGLRYNNLRNNRIANTTRFTGMVSASWQLNKTFGLDVNYNNNQIRLSHDNDTLRLSNIYSSTSISPRFTFEGLGGNNNLIFTFSKQDVSDQNMYTSKATYNNSGSISIIHSLIYLNTLSLTTTLLYNSAELTELTSRIYNISETVGRQFLKNKLTTSASLGVNILTASNNSSQLVFRINASYNLSKAGTFGFNLSNSSYNGSTGITQKYSELYGNIQYNISF